MKYVVDTHALIWFLVGSSRLGVDAFAALSDPSSELIVPGIVLAEACWLVEHGKTPIPSVSALLQSLDEDPRFSVFPIDRAVIQRSTTLATVGEMHDRLIVATTLTLTIPGEEVSLLTRDENISASSVVPVVW